VRAFPFFHQTNDILLRLAEVLPFFYGLTCPICQRTVEWLHGLLTAEKVAMIAAAHRRMLAASGIRFQHPEWSEEEIQAEVIRRLSRGTE